MAAPPSNPSPSNKPVAADATTSENAGMKAAETASDVSSPNETLLKEPTYLDSENSRWYKAAKVSLNSGDFETALITIEEGLNATKEILMKCWGNETNSETKDPEMHESVAPFHYLYGSTLLYSIEESTDSNQAMTVGGQPPDAGAESGEGEADTTDDVVDDLQITWENLDAARNVMQKMLAAKEISNGKEDSSSISIEKLKLDLAQVYLREGDLQKLNSCYDNAISDYNACLKYLEGNPLLGGPFDRKIADVHYNLGCVYLLLVAQTKSLTSGEGDEQAQQQAIDPVKLEQKLNFSRGRGFYHYVQCAMTFGGMLAQYCNQKPEELLQKMQSDLPKFKTCEEDDETLESSTVASMKLQSLRKRVAEMTPSPELRDGYEDLCELLDEIQETIDEAENAEEGVHQVSAMKGEISSAVAAQGDETTGNDQGKAAAAATTIGFGSATAATNTAAAQPITTMQVRKKKKRDADDTKPVGEETSKRPKQD